MNIDQLDLIINLMDSLNLSWINAKHEVKRLDFKLGMDIVMKPDLNLSQNSTVALYSYTFQ